MFTYHLPQFCRLSFHRSPLARLQRFIAHDRRVFTARKLARVLAG